MNFELIARKAINQLKSYSNFPKKGFLAGGSLSNLMWELVSGKKAIINDIDIFIFEDILTKDEIKHGRVEDKKLSYIQKEAKYFEDYKGICTTSDYKDYYLITNTENNDIYNNIYYSASHENPQLIINSFDINCTQVGYSIEEDKFYYTDEFVDFLKNGEVKVTNLLTPSHTAIRLIKKQFDLGAKLNEFEIQLCQFCIQKNMLDTNRRCFSTKYADLYFKYKSILDKYFSIQIDIDVSTWFKINKNVDVSIFRLQSVVEDQDKVGGQVFKLYPDAFNDENIKSLHYSQEFLFYMRNIYQNESNKKIWSKLNYLFNRSDYFDSTEKEEDIEMLYKLVTVAPQTINNLRGLKLSEQISIIKDLFDKYKDDPIIAISVLEKNKIDPNHQLDESDLLLLELSVRKEIIADTSRKVSRIFDKEKEVKVEVDFSDNIIIF